MKKILLLNGPNLNLLGSREPEKYGAITLAQLEANCKAQAAIAGASLSSVQSNHEGALVDAIHQAQQDGVAGIVFNPGAYTHTSIALRDALLAVKIPFIECHISNVYARETFRHHSYLSDIAAGVVIGFGVAGYSLALRGLLEQLKNLEA